MTTVEPAETRGAGAATLRARGGRPRSGTTTLSARDLMIPDDPTVLSYLLSGIVQVELPRRQALLEAATTVERLEGLIRCSTASSCCSSGRLRLFSPDPRLMGGARRS